MIYAIGNSNPIGNSLSGMKRHPYHMRGSRSMNLLNYIKNKPIPAGTKYFDVLLNKVSIRSTGQTSTK